MTRRLAALGLALGCLAGCRFQAARTANPSRDATCAPHCASTHERCVEQGQAKVLGLSGVTLDLCRRELESCLAGCPKDVLPPP